MYVSCIKSLKTYNTFRGAMNIHLDDSSKKKKKKKKNSFTKVMPLLQNCDLNLLQFAIQEKCR